MLVSETTTVKIMRCKFSVTLIYYTFKQRDQSFSLGEVSLDVKKASPLLWCVKNRAISPKEG